MIKLHLLNTYVRYPSNKLQGLAHLILIKPMTAALTILQIISLYLSCLKFENTSAFKK